MRESWWGGGFPPARNHRISAGHVVGSGVALVVYAPLVLLEDRARNALSHTAYMVMRDNAR